MGKHPVVLTDVQVAEARRLYDAGWSRTRIASWLELSTTKALDGCLPGGIRRQFGPSPNRLAGQLSRFSTQSLHERDDRTRPATSATNNG